MMKKLDWRAIPVLLFLALSVFLWRGLSLDPHHLPSVQIGKEVPAFHLTQLHDPKLSFDAKQLRNQVSLLNVWASWCEACTQENVLMMQVARAGIPIYGLNYKDKKEDALLWLNEWGDPYQMIGQDLDGKVAIDLGVYGAPETFVIDKQGIIRYRHVGIIDMKVWTKTLVPLIEKLEQEA